MKIIYSSNNKFTQQLTASLTNFPADPLKIAHLVRRLKFFHCKLAFCRNCKIAFSRKTILILALRSRFSDSIVYRESEQICLLGSTAA